MLESIISSEAAAATPTEEFLEEILKEYVEYIKHLGYTIKLTYTLSKYDGILMLKEVMENFVDEKASVNMEAGKAGKLVETVLSGDLEVLIGRIATLTANPVNNGFLEKILSNYKLSNKLNNTLKEITGIDLNGVSLGIEGKVKASIVAKAIVIACEILLH